MENEVLTNPAEETATETKTEGRTFTQDEFNSKLSEVLKEKEEKMQKKYANYYSADDLKNQTEGLNQQISELGNSLKVANEKASADAQTIENLQNQVKKYETDSVKIRIALDNGIPYELANKLSGSTEEEIRQDAERMAKYIAPSKIAPLRNPEANNEQDGVLAAFQKLNPNLKI